MIAYWEVGKWCHDAVTSSPVSVRLDEASNMLDTNASLQAGMAWYM